MIATAPRGTTPPAIGGTGVPAEDCTAATSAASDAVSSTDGTTAKGAGGIIAPNPPITVTNATGGIIAPNPPNVTGSITVPDLPNLANGSDVSVVPAPPPNKSNKYDWKAKDCHIDWQGITVTAGETNEVINKKKEYSRLLGITTDDGELILTKNMALDDLRKVGGKMGITGTRGKKKKDMADALVAFRAGKEHQQVNGTLEPTDTTGAIIKFITKRYINVLFSEKMKPLLARRAKSLNKKQLENKLSTDQELYETFIDEYNTDNPNYGKDAFEGIFPQDASNFQPFPSGHWKRAHSKFKDLTSEFEHYTLSWKKSGTHCDSEDVDVEDRDNTSPAMEYMYQHLRQSPELFNTCVSNLPSDVFSESSNGAPSSKSRNNKRGKSGGRKSNKANATDPSSAEGCLQSIASKNNIIEQKHCVEMQSHLREEVRKERKNKKEALSELAIRFDTKDSAKHNIKRFKDDAVDDEDSMGDPYTESQEELLSEYVKAERNIADAQLQLESVNKRTKTYL